MRILWIGKAPGQGEAGDEIFDSRTISALRSRGHNVTTIYPNRVRRWREVANLVKGLPHYRSRFDSPQNRNLIQSVDGQYDLTICSWEPLDVLSRYAPRPIVLIAHNVSSLALQSMFPSNRLARWAGRRAKAWERRIYEKNAFVAIAALSRQDRDYITRLPDPPSVLLTVPGMPRIVPLNDDAVFKPEMVIQGTFDWLPKRRDVMRFARDYASQQTRFPILSDALPPDARAALSPLPEPSDQACREAMRLGIITDRFVAGHKLKTLAYIARNHFVVSFCNASDDFLDIPDFDFFIREIHTVSGISTIMEELSNCDPEGLMRRFQRFQRVCAEKFTWSAVADTLTGTGSNRKEHEQAALF